MTEPVYALSRQSRSTTRGNLRLAALTCATAVSLAAGSPATAQMDDYGGGYYARGYGYDDGGPYGYAPRPPATIPPRAIGRAAQRDFGLTDIDRMVRTDASYIVDGRTARGARERLIFDRYSGRIVDRIMLDRQADRRAGRIVARLDPQERPSIRQDIIPRPPARPPELKTIAPQPSEATAPATMPAPSEPRRAAEPVAPVISEPAAGAAATPVEEPPLREAQAPASARVPPLPASPPVPVAEPSTIELAPVVPLY